MKTAWREALVADLLARGELRVEDGNHGEYRPRSNEFSAHGVPFIRAADLQQGRILFERADRITDIALARIRKGVGAGGDVILSHKGTVGRVAIAPLDSEPFVCSPQTTFWRVLDESVLDRRFLYYLLQSPFFRRQLNARKGETDMADYVSLTAQRSLRLLLPDIDEQRTIGEALGALDDKVDLNRRTKKTLEATARAIFKSWFVDFDPIHAKGEGRQPSSIGSTVPIPSEMRASPLGPIPEGWETKRIEEIVDVSTGVLEPGQHPDEMFDHYSIPAFDAEGLPAQQSGIEIKSIKRVIPEKSVLISRLNPRFPRVWWVFPPGGNRAISSTEFLVVTARENISRSFLYCLLRERGIQSRLVGMAAGTSGSHQRVPERTLLSMLVPVPPRSIVKLFDSVVDPMLKGRAHAQVETRTLGEVRDALLPRLVSGELRLGGAA
jgi:type I restriction enzyme, S subunit